MAKVLVLFLVLFMSNLNAETFNHPICQKELESLPILQNGRIKPLKVHALESIKHLTGKTTFQDLSATQIYCLLSLSMVPKKYPQVEQFSTTIDHVETQKLLGLSGNHPSIPFTVLVEKMPLVRSAFMSQKEDNSYKKDLSRLFQKIQLFQDITSGGNWTVPLLSNGEVAWIPFTQFFTTDVIGELKSQFPDATMPEILFKGLIKSKEDFINHKGDRYLLELFLINLHLVEIALSATLIALALLVITKKKIYAQLLTLTSLVAQLALVTFRVIVSGRAPVTNMYETVLFSGLGALTLALIIAFVRKENRYVGIGLAYNLCTLMMLVFADGMLNASIGPLVPVLRDNFWLSTHVTCVILSYGALGLSWIMSNYVLFLEKFKKLDKNDLHYFTGLIYTCLKVGTVLLALGVILGGVWADYSWGRFWGWDPKETWSLIVLCIYMAILHGKSTSWIPEKRFIPFTAAAFMSVMMAWFGVNYILATGLHSYGFSEGGAIFLLSFFAAQTAILFWSKLSINTNTRLAM